MIAIQLQFLRLKWPSLMCFEQSYRGADKSLARPGREKSTASEDFDFHISYL